MASIVGITAIYSPKKSAILVGAIAGLYVLSVALAQLLSLSMSAIPPGIMRPMTPIERNALTVLRSPLWLYILGSSISSVTVWSIVVLGKKIIKRPR